MAGDRRSPLAEVVNGNAKNDLMRFVINYFPPTNIQRQCHLDQRVSGPNKGFYFIFTAPPSITPPPFSIIITFDQIYMVSVSQFESLFTRCRHFHRPTSGNQRLFKRPIDKIDTTQIVGRFDMQFNSADKTTAADEESLYSIRQ